MFSLFKNESDVITIRCPMCSSSSAVKTSDIKESKNKKALSFRCSCGSHFHKRIIRKNLKEIDIIAAIARFDIETLCYKIKRVVFFLSGPSDPERIRLA